MQYTVIVNYNSIKLSRLSIIFVAPHILLKKSDLIAMLGANTHLSEPGKFGLSCPRVSGKSLHPLVSADIVLAMSLLRLMATWVPNITCALGLIL